ncbi:PTB domain-containing adapter protein ced-6-like isoform X2 [Ischnura elegans]|nr:PTB domain-containing adapter protein ced-6-like isoform X2 [Ischnura elegans]XP_046403077.1 PTB domain-containing adapter protein ced-6-like isoform X2 [Ischnura elegans]XP_046403078.1 PTB domain-containing adapter protein ced-6-like isoform X2 [Ischnura elegans]XP_046403079.1 PTB domain-containing adapter protein ced-6-like isoform X2 [Ischnura elegans]
MMKNSALLKWAQNSNSSKQHGGKGGNRNWIHPPDTLQRGHIAYLVKFLGSTEVEEAKGIEVVKEGIRKIKFSQQLRKAETGSTGGRTPKVELTISVDGVAVQDPKTKSIMYQFPLHRISYCADDKGEKKFFSFIAKEADSDKHICFVFVSDKLAEEITLTIGQAFELAYRRFLETSGKDLETQRRTMVAQQRVRRVEAENAELRRRLQDLACILGKSEVDDYLQRNNISDLLVVNVNVESEVSGNGRNGSMGELISSSNSSTSSTSSSSSSSFPSSPDNIVNNNSSKSSNSSNGLNHSNGTNGNHLINVSTNGVGGPPPVPPRSFETGFGANDPFNTDLLTAISPIIEPPAPYVGTRLQGLLLEEEFNPRAFESNTVTTPPPIPAPTTNGNFNQPAPLLAPPPKPASRRSAPGSTTSSTNTTDLFGSEPFNPPSKVANGPAFKGSSQIIDPFGMGDFGGLSSTNEASTQDLENAIGLLDRKILEMKDGFSRGISFGNEDFSIESLDPLRN